MDRKEWGARGGGGRCRGGRRAGKGGNGEAARVARKEGGGEGEIERGQKGGGDGEGGNGKGETGRGGKGEGEKKGQEDGEFHRYGYNGMPGLTYYRVELQADRMPGATEAMALTDS